MFIHTIQHLKIPTLITTTITTKDTILIVAFQLQDTTPPQEIALKNAPFAVSHDPRLYISHDQVFTLTRTRIRLRISGIQTQRAFCIQIARPLSRTTFTRPKHRVVILIRNRSAIIALLARKVAYQPITIPFLTMMVHNHSKVKAQSVALIGEEQVEVKRVVDLAKIHPLPPRCFTLLPDHRHDIKLDCLSKVVGCRHLLRTRHQRKHAD